MMERISFFGAVLLLSRLIQGSDAARPPQFVQEGHDVLLQVDEARVPQKFTLVFWRFNGDRNLVSFQVGKEEVYENYSGRVEICENKFSVRLKNVTAADSGVYSAQLIGDKTETLSEHDVRVEAVVSPVHLQVASVSDSCNVTVTCCTITHCSNFTCHKDACRREGGQGSEVTPTGASLHVYPSDGAIFCNHSNHVSFSWNTTEALCRWIDPPPPRRFVIYIVVSLVLILLVVVVVVFCYRRRGRYDRQNVEKNVENTVYAVCEAEKTEPPEQLDAPPTTYSFVGQGSRSSERKTRDESLPESLYAKVGKTERC